MRPLPAPLELSNSRTGDTYTLVASDAQNALLTHAPGVKVPPTNARLMLVRPDGLLGPVELFVKITGLATDKGKRAITARWMLITARRRRQYLIRVLGEILGLNVRQTAEDRLEPNQKLIYDATKQQVRLIKTDASGTSTVSVSHEHDHPYEPEPLVRTTQPEVAVEKPARKGGSFFGLKADVRDIAALRIVSGSGERKDAGTRKTIGREGPRPEPVYRRDRGKGTWRAGDADPEPMACGWLGLSHLLFVIPTAHPPKLGTVIEVAIPADPILVGHVRLTGPITQLTIDATVERTIVEIEIGGHALPSIYRQLVAHWAGVS